MNELNPQTNSVQPKKHGWGRKLAIVILFIFLSLVIAVVMTVVAMVKKIKKDGAIYSTNIEIDMSQSYQAESKIKNQNYILGSADAKITIVEFADFSCVYSRQYFQALRNVTLRHAKDIRLIHRDYLISENGLALSLSARCAGEQGMFWPMHDKLFAATEVPTQEKADLLAEGLGLNMDKYNDCIAKQTPLKNIKIDILEAEKVAVKGTPTTFINGYKIDGPMAEVDLEKIITNFINKKN